MLWNRPLLPARCALVGLAAATLCSAAAGQIIFDNASSLPGAIAPVGIVTNPGAGFGGGDASVLTAPDNIFGFGHASGNRLADDFTIPAGQTWTITGAHVFGYVTGAVAPGTTAGTLRILNGPPNAGGVVVAGDTTTNVLTSAAFNNIYRVLPANLLDTSRRIVDNTLTLGAPVVLGPGTYWVEYGLTGNSFVPPISASPAVGGQATGNAVQFLSGSSTYGLVIDGAGPAVKGIPFQLTGFLGITGACCGASLGACTITSSTACAAPSTYQGDGTTCTPNPCSCGVRNGGFEERPFTSGFIPGWTLIGNPLDLGVSTTVSHTGVSSGSIAAVAIPAGFGQTIPVAGGATLRVEFWLRRDAVGPNSFSADFDGQNLLTLTDALPFPFTQHVFSVVTTNANPTLSLTGVSLLNFYFIDDVSVCLTSTACCDPISGACSVITAGSCPMGTAPAAAGGGGCNPSPCPMGACCEITGPGMAVCTMSGPAGCTGPTRNYREGVTCSVAACQDVCCSPTTGLCFLTFTFGCSAGLNYMPQSTCSLANCPKPTACCDSTSGACMVAAPGVACPAGTTAAAPVFTSCTPSPCPQPTACCDTTTGACTVALPLTACAAGTVASMGSACSPGLCPQPLACCDTTSGACTVVPPGVGGAVCGAGTVAAPGNAAACTPGLCPQPIACCNFITGVCVVVRPGAACAAGSVAAPGSPAACVPYPCPLIGAVGLACPDCTWVNGAFDGVSGQDSHLGGAIPLGSKAADDFFLCEDFIYDLQTISATLLTTTDPLWVKPIAEIYEDCNGCPGARLYRLETALVVETGLTHSLAAPDGRPLRIIHASWTIDNSQLIVNNRNIVLKGGRYWLSVYGRTDNFSLMTPPMYDVTYWGTTGNGALGVKGLPARKISGRPTPLYNQFNFPDFCGFDDKGGFFGWRSVTDGCCIGCTDLNFSVCTRPCKILIDNGPARNLPGVALGSTSQYAIGSNSPLETRSADDFVIPPCQAYTICYVEACVLTNCLVFEGVFELYNNDCHKPSYTLHGIPFGGVTNVATKVIDLGFVWTVGTAMYRAYKLEFHDLAIVVPGGTQMWISAGVRYTFSLTERAFFCYNEPCALCDIKWNPGRVLTVSSLDLDPPLPGQQPRLGWAALVDDFSFLIAADGNTTAGPINSDPPPTPTPSCAADFNRDGALNVTDIFDYLTGWFAGCP